MPGEQDHPGAGIDTEIREHPIPVIPACRVEALDVHTVGYVDHALAGHAVPALQLSEQARSDDNDLPVASETVGQPVPHQEPRMKGIEEKPSVPRVPGLPERRGVHAVQHQDVAAGVVAVADDQRPVGVVAAPQPREPGARGQTEDRRTHGEHHAAPRLAGLLETHRAGGEQFNAFVGLGQSVELAGKHSSIGTGFEEPSVQLVRDSAGTSGRPEASHDLDDTHGHSRTLASC